MVACWKLQYEEIINRNCETFEITGEYDRKSMINGKWARIHRDREITLIKSFKVSKLEGELEVGCFRNNE